MTKAIEAEGSLLSVLEDRANRLPSRMRGRIAWFMVRLSSKVREYLAAVLHGV